MPYADEYKRRNGAASGLVLLILTFMAAVIGVIWGLS
jgi:hypothetical protein